MSQERLGVRHMAASDPNREGDEEYIVRLALRVTTVSLATQKLLAALTPLFAG